MSKAWLENWGSAQDLAQYVAERLPSQAQPSMRSTSAVEHAQPMESADRSDESITDTLAKLVKDILGAKVSVHQPFMEVSVTLCQSSCCQVTGGPDKSDFEILGLICKPVASNKRRSG